MTTQTHKPILLALLVPVLYVVLLYIGSWAFSPIPFPYSQYFFGICGCGGAMLLLLLVRRWDGNAFTQTYKWKKSSLPNFFIGLLGAILTGALMMGSQIWYSDLSLSFQQENVSGFFTMIWTVLPLAIMEELAFRSYTFFKLREEYGVWKTQIFMAILFALYHVVLGWSVIDAFVGPGIWAFAYGLLALKSGGIAVPTGFHAGLNLLLAMIGDKDWVPGLWVIDFAENPTTEMIQSNTNFGFGVQSVLLVVLILSTWIYARNVNRTTENQ